MLRLTQKDERGWIMSHERIIKSVSRRDRYADMVESGFRDRGLPPYAYTELCPDPDYRPSVMRKRKEGVYGK